MEDLKIFAQMESEGEIMGRARHHWKEELDWMEAIGKNGGCELLHNTRRGHARRHVLTNCCNSRH